MALLFNIRAIEKHFEPILTAQNSCLSEKDILGLIQSNYDALNLRMLEGLDQFERFSCSLNKVTVRDDFFVILAEGLKVQYNFQCS